MSDSEITCALCGLICKMQISASHLRAAHQITTKEYRAMGHKTLSLARLEQLRQSPIGRGDYPPVFGKESSAYKGGSIDANGYRVIYVEGVRTLEHRHVVEQSIGRKLDRREQVHHIDGNKINNELSNLKILSPEEHARIGGMSKRRFDTNEDCVEACYALCDLGWNAARIARGLRVHYNTVFRWISSRS